MNRAAQALGRLAAGKPKNYSAEEIARRSKILAGINARKRSKTKKTEQKANDLKKAQVARNSYTGQWALGATYAWGRVLKQLGWTPEAVEAALCEQYKQEGVVADAYYNTRGVFSVGGCHDKNEEARIEAAVAAALV